MQAWPFSCRGNTMEILLQLVFSGIALGMIYAVIAFGYQLTFATSGTLNFGQGESLMLGALVGLSLVGTIHGGPYMGYLLMIPIVIVFGACKACSSNGSACGRPSRSSPNSAGSCPPSRWPSSSRTWPRTSGARTT
jgi:branched-subunit amino acid ABC-type transport system permease component